MRVLFIILTLIVVAYSQIVDVVGTFQNVVNGIKDDASNAVSSIKDTVVNAANSSFQALQSQTMAVVDGAKNNVVNAVNTVKTTIENDANQAIQAVQDKANQLKDTVVSLANTTISFVQSEVNKFLDQLKDISNFMCQNVCTSFFNLPCFLLFSCSDKTRKFFLVMLPPTIVLIVIIVGLNLGLFTYSCLCKFFLTITGIYPLYRIIRYCCRKDLQAQLAKVKLQLASRVIKDK